MIIFIYYIILPTWLHGLNHILILVNDIYRRLFFPFLIRQVRLFLYKLTAVLLTILKYQLNK